MQKRKIDGIEIDIHSDVFNSANILKAEAGTTGFCGGDTGHGGRTYFALEDLGSTDISFNVSGKRLEVYLGGDCELYTITDALKFITNIFEKAINKKEDNNND